MAIFKCKMCGGALEISGNATVAECEYCGTRQTLPKLDDENKHGLFNRANNLRLKSEFDKAEQVYEKIIELDDKDSEAHWGIVLCKYGIEYVEDPKTFKRVPTCHRTAYESIITDEDYIAAIENADDEAKAIYEAEAKAIGDIQKNILSVVNNEKPFDVFICYKETDENGKRTVDSSIANDIYYQLTQEGFRVFYAAITLEEKLGQEYEPYIFAALNSAKVMLVVGTKPEYFNAVWVRNEWSRYLKLMKTDRSKLLIPCYKDMDAYDLPEEFSHLQAQDMDKIGFINDITRGIKKILKKEEPAKEAVREGASASFEATAESLLKRAFMFLEDGEFGRADEFCEKVLNVDPECAEAYLGKLMVELGVRKFEDLSNCDIAFESSPNYQRALRYGDEALKNNLSACNENVKYNITMREIGHTYNKANSLLKSAKKTSDYLEAIKYFEVIRGYKDTDELLELAVQGYEESKKSDIYLEANRLLETKDVETLQRAVELFESLEGWRNSENRIEVCKSKIEAINKEKENTLYAIRYNERAKKINRWVANITTWLQLAFIGIAAYSAVISEGVLAVVLIFVMYSVFSYFNISFPRRAAKYAHDPNRRGRAITYMVLSIVFCLMFGLAELGFGMFGEGDGGSKSFIWLGASNILPIIEMLFIRRAKRRVVKI